MALGYSKKRANTPQAKKFGRVAKAANQVCHAETNSVGTYKSCMRREMKKGFGKRKKGR